MNDEKYNLKISFLNKMKPFKNIYDIPSIPIMRSKDDYEKYVIFNFIRCGAIPKSKLEIGKTYIGDCRNSSEAIWLGNHFEYDRNKFGFTFKEKINHFEDDNGFDLFVPLYEKK